MPGLFPLVLVGYALSRSNPRTGIAVYSPFGRDEPDSSTAVFALDGFDCPLSTQFCGDTGPCPALIDRSGCAGAPVPVPQRRGVGLRRAQPAPKSVRQVRVATWLSIGLSRTLFSLRALATCENLGAAEVGTNGVRETGMTCRRPLLIQGR